MEMNEGLFLVQDDNGIRKVLNKINSYTDVLEFFANHEVDALVFAQDILAINYEIDPPIDEVAEDNEVAEDDEVAYNSFMKMEDIESDKSEDDDAGRSVSCHGRVSGSTKFVSYVPPTTVVKLLQHSGLGSNTGMGFHPMKDVHQCLENGEAFLFGFVDLFQNSGGCLVTD